MRKATCIVGVLGILPLAVGLLYPSPSPEEIIDLIVEGKITYAGHLYRDDFPIEVLIDHLQDIRPLGRPLYATRGPNRVWMVCSKALQRRLGLGPDPAIQQKWWLPVPESFEDRAKFREWWEASSKDELLIRHQMATWQLAEMEKSPDYFEVHLPFKRRQVALTKQQLDAR